MRWILLAAFVVALSSCGYYEEGKELMNRKNQQDSALLEHLYEIERISAWHDDDEVCDSIYEEVRHALFILEGDEYGVESAIQSIIDESV